ncbi:protease complex subunit PrcB family protein [Rhizobacter sp. LjRoot28]|uniref:protease complex subunit PrcB family protein n=1 Tax=Rhizobacter sp. LjRoot28 TaxID=3342309 RepID=UPI003ECD19A7
MTRCLSLLATLGVTIGMVACAAPGEEATRWPIASARSHAQCPLAGDRPAAWLVESAAQWSSLAQGTAERAAGTPVDWSRDQLIVVSIGMKPTLGHQVAASSDSVSLQGRDARLAVNVSAPAPDAMTASALSHPCVVLRVARRNWQDLTVVDQAGATLWQGTLSGRR